MDLNSVELQMPRRGLEEEERISPNFLETDPLAAFTNPFDMDVIDDCKDSFPASNPDGMNMENDLPDNAVDPYVYINKGSDSTPSSPSFELSPNSVASPNVQLPWMQSTTQASASYARQQSVNFVMEVLSAFPVENNGPKSNISEPTYPLTPSPQLGDEDLIDHPSPFFSNLEQEAQRSRTVSEHIVFPRLPDEQSRSRAFSFDHAPLQDNTFCFRSSSAKSTCNNGTETGSSNANNTTTSSTSDNQTTTTSSATETTPDLESLPSIVKESLLNQPKTICEDSLDMDGMMADFISNSDPVAEGKLEECPVSSPVVDLTKEEPSTSQSVPKMERTASYKKRRDQNNKACRESRKKRKLKQTETEIKAKELELENEELRTKIARLEKDVEEVRVLVLKQMSRQPKR